MTDARTAPITIALRLGAEQAFTQVTDVLVRVLNDHDVSQAFWAKTPNIQVALPFHDGPGDDYRIVVNVKGYVQAGAFVHADPTVHAIVEVLLIPDAARFQFPAWDDLKARFPVAARLVAAGVSEADAAARYGALGQERPLALASLLNLCAAMERIGLGGQQTPMDFIREVIWDGTLAQDRFFGWADPAIIPLVQAAAAEQEFAEEENPGEFHKGATLSYKQTEFDYSNVQLTFHQNDTRIVDGVSCVMIEPDMDLFKDLLAHGVGEVIPNLSTKTLTNPLDVLALRWLDAVQSDEPLFDPGYLLV